MFLISDQPLSPPLFNPHGLRAKIVKAAIEIAAGAEHVIMRIDDEHGALHYLAINLEDDDELRVKIEVDGAIILNHTIDEIATTGAGKLGLEVTKAASGFLNVVRDDSLNAVLVINAAGDQLHWNRQFMVSVINKGTATFDIQGSYILYHEIHN